MEQLLTDKFYLDADFKKLQKEWYKKLKKSGFEDLENIRNEKELGFGSWKLSNKTSLDTTYLSKNYSAAKFQHFRICQNFLTHAEFYSNLLKIFKKINNLPSEGNKWRQSSTARQSFEDFFDSHDFAAWQDEEAAFEMYINGLTYPQISAKLRSLFKSGKLHPRLFKPKKSLPYSLYWVYYRIQKLIAQAFIWNQKHPEGLLTPEALETNEFVDALGYGDLTGVTDRGDL